MRRIQVGFTLIELICALVVTSLLVTTLFHALKISYGAWERVTSRTSQLDAIATIQQSLRSKIETLMPLTDRQLCGGNEMHLRFISTSPDASLPGVSANYTLIFSSESHNNSLEIHWCSAHQGILQSCSTDAHEQLLTGISTGRFSYFFLPSNPASEGKWDDNWVDCATPPALIRINVDFDDPQRLKWPDLVVRPRLSYAADCQYDSVSQLCR
jgi:prepilin-type N-terminal cleavage/methylation domain-containing protein